jgi:DNA-binding transcriptional LysR family regulator
MKLDIDGIQAFVLVAELGGFHKAAAKLNLSQTALTRRIQKLERYLGLQLLNRTTRSVSLTAVGREFLPRAARLVEELTRSVDHLKDMSRWATGDVAIACVPSMAYQQLPTVIRAYAAKYPGNRVRLIDRNSEQVTEAVRTGEAELGIHIQMRAHPELTEQPLLHDPFVLFCRTDHPVSELPHITWKALRAIDLIAVSGSSGNRALLDHQLARHNIDLRGRYEVEHPSTAIALVSAGVGAAILPAATLLHGTHPDVRRVPLQDPVIRRTLGLIRRRNAALSPAAQAFHDLLAEQLLPPPSRARRGRAKQSVPPVKPPASN